MGGMSIDGLVTGLDTSSLIQQLLHAEKAPQRQLQAKQADLRTMVKVFTELNTKFKAIADAAEELSSATDWAKRAVTSSDEKVVTAEVTGTPASGTLTFKVTSLAATQTDVSVNGVAATDPVTDGSDLVVNGTTIAVAAGSTASQVAAAINGADAGVVATTVQVSPGVYKLQVASTESGAAGTTTVTGGGLATSLGGFAEVSAGADASITVGTGAGAYAITSSTNTFADVMPGLSFTAASEGTATVTVATDAEGLADAVDELVKAMNDVQTFIADRSKYDAATNKGGVFLGESMPSRLRTQLQNALIDPVSGSSLVGKDLGVETDRFGKVSFDRSKFLAAHASDPAAVESFFGAGAAGTVDDGVAERLSRLATEATRLNTGTISSFIAGREDQIRLLDDQIERWDVRLELRETALRRQFSAMETALGRMQQQGQWLSGQLASLYA